MPPYDDQGQPNGDASDQNTNLQPNNGSTEPEIVDVRNTPQYQEYLRAKTEFDNTVSQAKQAADSSDEGTSRMLDDNPALRFQGSANDSIVDVQPIVEAQTVEPVQQEPEPIVDQPQMQTPEKPVAQTPVQPPVVEQVAVVEPVAPVAQPEVTDEQPKPKKPVKKDSGRVLGLFSAILTLLFFVALAVVGFFLLPSGQTYLQDLGLGAESLTLLTAVISGLLTLLAFLGVLLGTFKLVASKKEQKKLKRRGFALSVVSGLVLIASIIGLVLSLSAIGPGTSTSQNPADYIITDPTPLRNLTAPVEVSFDASALPFDPTVYEIISYRWNFGDGSQATGSSVTHMFTSKPDSGIYNTSLIVTYRKLADGEQIDGEPIVIPVGIINEQALIDFDFTPEFGEAPLTISFDASKSSDPDGDLVTFEWDFDGDAITDASGERVQYEFIENGTYTVNLTAVDTNGASFQTQKTITLEADSGFTITLNIDPEEKPLREDIGYLFNASDSETPDDSTIIDYSWNFGDETQIQKGQKVTHSFVREGKYELKLTVITDSGRTFTKEFPIQVGTLDSSPVAVITSLPGVVGGVITGTAPLKVTFSANDSTDPNNDIVDYSWDFDGDGVADQAGANSEYTFREPGTYKTVLKVTDTDGYSDTSEVTVDVANRGVQAQLTATPVAGESPLTVTFDASATTTDQNDKIVTFEWNFKDGTPVKRDNAQVTYIYKQVGTYIPTVTAVTESGQRSTASITINANPVSLKACYTMSRHTGTAPLTVEFNAKCSRGVIGSYLWNFADGQQSIERQPVHTFTEPGVYQIELTLEKDNIISTFTDEVEVK